MQARVVRPHVRPEVPRVEIAPPSQDKSGVLDSSELATLYRQARAEKLSGKQLKAAMVAMDADNSGTIEFSEFEAWSVSISPWAFTPTVF